MFTTFSGDRFTQSRFRSEIADTFAAIRQVHQRSGSEITTADQRDHDALNLECLWFKQTIADYHNRQVPFFAPNSAQDFIVRFRHRLLRTTARSLADIAWDAGGQAEHYIDVEVAPLPC